MSAALLLVTSSHALEVALDPPVPRARAKCLARPDRLVSARVFDAACAASRLSNRMIGRWLGVRESVVRRMRSGDKPVSFEQLLRVPPSVATGMGVALIEHAKSRAIGSFR